MSQDKLSRAPRNRLRDEEMIAEDFAQVCSKVKELAISYATHRPAGMALACLGIGFILGWRLKPW